MRMVTRWSDVNASTRSVVRMASAALVVLCIAAPVDAAVTDDFADGNDTVNPTWIHLDGAVLSTGQTWDASSGKYRLQAPSNGSHPELFGYGFVGSRVEPLYTDVKVSADFVDFPTGATGGFFGIAARLNGNNGPPVSGTGIALQGYSYQYEANARGGQGEVVLNILLGGGFKDIGSLPVSLDPLKDYRFSLEAVGNVLHGQVYELMPGGELGDLVAERIRDLDLEPVGNVNHDGDAGTPDVPFVPFTSGYAGTFGVGHVFLSDIDYTIDNFRAESLAAIPGDFNADGDVDAADLATWKGAFGATNAGDTDNDGDSDGADFLVWQQHVTGSLAATGAASIVPEPALSAFLLPLMGALAAARHRRRA